MTETKVQTTPDSSEGLEDANLPAVIETQDGIKPVYIYDIYTNKPGLVIILSERFNLLAKEKAVSPDFSALEEMGWTVKIQEWSTSSRALVTSTNGKAVSDSRKVILLESDKGRELIEDLALKGFEKTLLPIMTEIETDMESQLEAEMNRIQELIGRAPK